MFTLGTNDQYEMNLNVLRANRWEMTDERTGQPMRGVSLVTIGRLIDTPNSLGADFGKMSADYGIFDKLKGLVPGSVRCLLEQKQSGGKMVPVVVDVLSKVETAPPPASAPGYAAAPGAVRSQVPPSAQAPK